MQLYDIKKHIPEQELDTIKYLVDVFIKNGFQCYLIGGSVRDLIIGHRCNDYDFATNARPDEILRLFQRVIPTGIKHGTVTVIINDISFEITTYRSDGKYINGRHPDTVTFSKTLKEDVVRRDFTINGLAYDIVKDEIIDYVNGMEDIDKKIVRTIDDPMKRFSEDGLRTFRACRLASKLGFIIEEKTFFAISQTLDVARKVSVERIRDELVKILQISVPSVGIEYLRKCGLLTIVLPELASSYEIYQNKYHVHDIYYHSIYSCDSAPLEHPSIRLAALLHDIGKVPTKKLGEGGDYTFYNHEVVGAKMARGIMKRLKFSNEEIERVNNLVLNHMFHYTDEWTDGAVRRFMRKVGTENINDMFLLRLADRKGNGSREGMPEPIKKLIRRIGKIIEEENAISLKDLKINGHMLMEKFNMKPGPKIGRILNELLEVVLDDPDKNESETLCLMAGEIIDRTRSEQDQVY